MGDPTAVPRAPATFVAPDLDAPCWLWPGAVDEDGYGKWRGHSAHRELWERLFGELPDEVHVDHLCHNPPCVNPAHLEPVSCGENNRRRLVIPMPPRTSADRYITHCPNGHERTPENTHRTATGGRRCRICRRANERRQYRAKRLREQSA